MDHYIDILLKPSKKITENQSINFLYHRFHNVLARYQFDRVGVSFPKYKLKAGDIFRIHGDKDDLVNIDLTNCIGSMKDFFEIGSITPVPALVNGYRIVSRVRTNMSKSKLVRLKRRGAIKNINEERAYKAKMFSQSLTAPYFDLESSSTGQKFRLFIKFGELMPEPVDGKFDTYGLSKVATVPWF